MNSEDKKFWTVFRNTVSNKISKEEYQRISKMHAFYKKHAFYLPCTCNPKGIQRFIDDLNEIYEKI
jgi:hypothetical protein